jgi:hypothetical protein
MTSPCSSGDLQFIIYEVENDFYNPAPIPSICDAILRAGDEASLAQQFLAEGIPDQNVRGIWGGLKSSIFQKRIDATNKDEVLEQVRGAMESVATAVFASPEVVSLPMGIKRHLNFLIFNAISAKVHFPLMMAFNAAYENDNKHAQHASRNFPISIKINMSKMEEAVRQLHNILHLPNPVAIIHCLEVFFDAMVAALPGVEVAADDILPAICLAMTRDVGFGSHVVSFFNYLTEIWPSSGMDERVTYILVTCSIAAQHLASIKETDTVVDTVKTAGTGQADASDPTIGLLQDLLDCI